jgi:ribose-phosphate pyrophosphokinase
MPDTWVFALPGSEPQAHRLCEELGARRAAWSLRSFPDQESYVRIDSALRASDVVLVCTLDDPNPKLLPLYFLATAAREQGARSIGLVAPYLAYMRQDTQFQEGEAVTSTAFACLLSSFLDWLVTVDPHLHRRSSLDEIYTLSSRVVHAAPAIAEWIRTHVEAPLLVGPDEESAQWVSAIADAAGAPYTVLRKVRRGDRDVEITIPEVNRWRGHTPVLADDIISTGRTMAETLRRLCDAGLPRGVCIGVHAIFAERAFEELEQAGARSIVTCDTISHPSNGMDLAPALAREVRALLDLPPAPRVERR